MRFDELKRIDLSVLKQPVHYEQHLDHNWQIDWDRLAELINDNQEQIAEVRAGLAEDWLRTNGIIWDARIGYHRHPNSHYEYEDAMFWGYSSWATPMILVTFVNEKAQAYQLYKNGMDDTFHYLGGPDENWNRSN